MSEPLDPYQEWLGIPPKDQPPNHYRLLAIELFEDDLDVISHAADRAMAHVRTFQLGPHSAVSQKLLNELAAARGSLLDPAKKVAYDRDLRLRLLATQGDLPSPPVQPPSPIPLAPVRPAPAPIPIATPVVQPQPAAAAAAFAPGSTDVVPALATDAPARRRFAWQGPVAVLIVGATLAACAHYLLQYGRQRAAPAATGDASPAAQAEPRPVAAAGQDESSPAERPTFPAAAVNETQTAAGEAQRSPPARSSSRPLRRAPRVDLLRLIDPERDAIKGAWRLEQGRLISPAEFAPRLAIPFRLPPEYTLSVTVERLSGDDAFDVGLVAGDFKVVAAVDGWRGAASGLHLVDGLSAEDNDTTTPGPLLRDGEPNALIYDVMQSHVRVVCNGKLIVDFRGDFNRLSWPANFGEPVPGRLELIGSSDARFAIERLELTVVSDPEKLAGPISRPKPAETPKQATSAQAETMRERKTLAGLLKGPAVKPEPPAKGELAKAEREARELLREPLAGAKTPEQKQALARMLLERGAATQDDPAAQYAILKLAIDTAAEGGHAAVAIEAVDELAKWFKIDAGKWKLDALAEAGKSAGSPQLKQDAIKAALELIDRFVEEDAYDKGAKAAAFALSAARPLKDLRLSKEVADKKREVERLGKLYAALADDLARLAADSGDLQANSEVGKFYCLTKLQWERGLPLLARGSNPAYRTLAERELQMPDTAAAQKELADEWWSLAQTEKGPANAALLKRAALWYGRAAPLLAGVDREAAEQRMREAEAGDGSGGKATFLADMPEADLSVDNNRLDKGRDDAGNELTVNGRPSPKGLLFQPPAQGVGRVTYIINKRAKLFTADVGVNPFPYDAPASPLIFELVGDGAVLWRSQPIAQADQTDHCEVAVGKVVTLELRAFCSGGNAGAKAVWIEPRLTMK